MKYVGMCCILAACIWMGQYYSASASMRIRALEQILLLAGLIKSELAYCRTPVRELMRHIIEHSELSELPFLKQCSQMCEQGIAFPSAWSAALNKRCAAKALRREDIELLHAFGTQLGTTDLEGQLSLCGLYTRLFEERLVQAREWKRKYAKLYTSLGVLGGLLIWVLFL